MTSDIHKNSVGIVAAEKILIEDAPHSGLWHCPAQP